MSYRRTLRLAFIAHLIMERKDFSSPVQIYPGLLCLEKFNMIVTGFHLRPRDNVNGGLMFCLKVAEFFPLFIEQIIGNVQR